MVIDAILDRKDGCAYNKEYLLLVAEEDGFDYINAAFNSYEGNKDWQEYQAKRALCKYILDNEYNIEIISYILTVNWL